MSDYDEHSFNCTAGVQALNRAVRSAHGTRPATAYVINGDLTHFYQNSEPAKVHASLDGVGITQYKGAGNQ